MGKRKREKTSVETVQKGASSCSTALHSLLGSTLDLEGFKAAHWERKPAVFQSSDIIGRRRLASLFTLTTLWDCVERAQDSDHPLQQGRDINVVRYKDGVRETLEDQEEGDCERWQQLYKEGWTLQVHQPQRFCDALTKLCFSLERQLGCLVGSNAYITPAGAQGLAPHHDDVEIFVVQTEGRKKWRLYAPVGGFELPSTPSNDLSEEAIGEPTMSVTLEVGDVLYLPRGTVHEAITDDDSASCHVTISTYQRFSFATLAQHVLDTLTEGQTPEACLPLEMRRGLPIGFLYQHGLQHDAGVLQKGARKQSTSGSSKSDGATSAASLLAHGLRKLADAVESDPALLSMAADSMAVDFMASRLPPKEGSLPEVGEAPTQSSSVRCRGSGLFRMMPLGDHDTPEDTGGGWVKVMSCLHNDVDSHMMGSTAGGCEQEGTACCHKHGDHSHASDDGEGDASEEIESASEEEEEEEESDEGCGEGATDLVFPASYSFAIAQLLGTADGKGIKVSDINLPSKEDRLGLAFALWSEGVICTVPSE